MRFPNPDAMLAVMLAGGAAELDLDYRYEQLFNLRNAMARANAEGQVEVLAELSSHARQLLENEFAEPLEPEDIERGSEIISGLYLNPREIDDLTESQIGAIEDTAVCAGFMRTMMRSYGIDLSDDTEWLMLIMKYRRFLA